MEQRELLLQPLRKARSELLSVIKDHYSVGIDEIIRMLVSTGINREEVAALKREVEAATNKNQVIVRVLSTPGALCEQFKGLISKIIR